MYIILAIILVLILILICICYKFISNRIRYQQMEELNINDRLPVNEFEMVEMVEIQIKSDDEDGI